MLRRPPQIVRNRSGLRRFAQFQESRTQRNDFLPEFRGGTKTAVK
jgi:hypothetical protein